MSSYRPGFHTANGIPGAHAAAHIGIYVHIPFCVSRCLYCDFHTTATDRVPWHTYLRALTAELAMLEETPFRGRTLDTLFVGGGTPTVYPPLFFDRLLQAIFAAFPPAPDIEITVEANPGTVSRDDLRALHHLGVNRLSLGVQSFHDRHLRTLTRIHDARTALQAILDANQAGFDNLSIDLISGIPGQTVADWVADLEQAAALPVVHCATYALTVYEGTRLAANVAAGRVQLPDDDTQAAMFQATAAVLEQAGFRRYEISNWSRGRPCRHNVRYWESADWLGLGSGAHGHASSLALAPACVEPGSNLPIEFVPAPHGGRWWAHRDIHRYVTHCLEARTPYAGAETLTRQQAMTETLLTRLRCRTGLALDTFAKRFGTGPVRHVLARAQDPTLSRLLAVSSNTPRLTPAGTLFADRIVLELSEAADQGLQEGPMPRT